MTQTHAEKSTRHNEHLTLFVKGMALDYLAGQLPLGAYPRYPEFPERLRLSPADAETDPIALPEGPWNTGPTALPGLEETARLSALGLRFDSLGRPLHPWFSDMVAHPDIGIVTGKGFYLEWGPNYTADPIVIRYDLGEPHLLMIDRGDTGKLALPGGFLNKHEGQIDAAFREAEEETGLKIKPADAARIAVVYNGPVADIRTTAHAWAETAAVLIELPDKFAAQFTQMQWDGRDDAKRAYWKPVSQVLDGPVQLSQHEPLIRIALGEAA